MKRYFEFVEGSSGKFWEIEVVGSKQTVRFGRMGTTGQGKSKSFGSAEAAEKDADSLIKSKLAKGYREAGSGGPATPKTPPAPEKTRPSSHELETLASSTDPKLDLYRHFSYLCDTPGFGPVLAAILKNVEAVAIDKGNLVVRFQGQDDPWLAHPAAKPEKYLKYPKSYQALVAHHEFMSFDPDRLHFGDRRSLDFGMYSEGDNVYELFEGKSSKVHAPIDDYISNTTVWVYSPEEVNAQGEPAIFPIVHELEDEIHPIYLNAGSLFLKLMIDKAGWKIPVPKVEGPNAATDESGDWYGSLDDNWRRIFRVACKFPRGTVHSDEPENPVTKQQVYKASIERLNCLGLPITDLEPLATLGTSKKFSLEHIDLQGTRVTDLSPLAVFSRLSRLDISGTPVAAIPRLPHLRTLIADRCASLDFKTVNALTKLNRVYLRQTALCDLTPFLKLKGLTELRIVGSKVSDEQILLFKKARKPSSGEDPLFIDLRPEISDPLLRRLEELADYEPEKAIAAGEEALAKMKGTAARLEIVSRMVDISEAAVSRYLYTDVERFRRFVPINERTKYMKKSGDLTDRRSIKEADSKEIAQHMLGIYKNRAHYSEANLKADSFFAVRLFATHLKASTYHDVAIPDIEKAAVESGLFEHKKTEDVMYVKPK